MRHFPAAQKALIDQGGFQVLSDVFRSRFSDDRLRVKIVTLLSDLLIERHYALADKDDKDRQKQYKKFVLFFLFF